MKNYSLSTSSASQVLSALSDQVRSADLMGGGLVITFENGKTAVYSSALLKQMLWRTWKSGLRALRIS